MTNCELYHSLIYKPKNLGLMKLNKFPKVRHLANSRFESQTDNSLILEFTLP